jgi:hypothetical protein
MNNDLAAVSESDLFGANLEDSGAEPFRFLEAEAMDGFELSEGLRASEHNAAEGGRGKDEEERKTELFGLGLTPVSESLVKRLLVGGKGVGGVGRGLARAREGFD